MEEINPPIYFISDCHFTIDKGDSKRRQLMFSLFEKIKIKKGTLVIGGDFLDFWFDYKTNPINTYNDIFDALENLSEDGVKIYYLLGNHDYWDFGFFKKKFNAKIYKDELVIKTKNQKIKLLHGDGVLVGDFVYRIFKSIIRSKLCIYLFNLLPSKIGVKISKIISNTHHREYYENVKIKDKLYHFAEKNVWNNNINIFLVGHYHQLGIVDDKQNDNNKIIFLGDWLHNYTVTKFENNQWTQENWQDILKNE